MIHQFNDGEKKHNPNLLATFLHGLSGSQNVGTLVVVFKRKIIQLVH